MAEFDPDQAEEEQNQAVCNACFCGSATCAGKALLSVC